MQCLKQRHKQIGVIVGMLALNDRHDPLQAHSCVYVLLGKWSQTPTSFPTSTHKTVD